MEPEKIDPAILAVELYREEELHRRRTWFTAAIALSCTLLGAVIVLASVRFAPQWFAPPTVKVATVDPITKPAGPARVLYTEPKDPAITPGEKKPVSSTPTQPAPPVKDSQPNGGSSAPFNPFSGAIIGRSGVPDGWQPGQPHPEAGKPDAEPKKTATPPQASEAILVTARASSGDPEGSAAEVASALQGLGASVRTAPHYNLAGGVIGVQVIATLPAASVESAIGRLSSAGVGGAGRWKGSPDARADRVAGILASRIGELRKQESELREKYEDDATEVAVVREEIQKLNQGIAVSRSARSAGVAVFLIGIGSL